MSRTVRGTGVDNRELSQNLDAIGVAIGKVPNLFYTEGNLIELEFTGSTLDQTVPHKLRGKHKGVLPMMPVASAPVDIYTTTPSNPKTVNTHVRFISNGVCKLTVFVWR